MNVIKAIVSAVILYALIFLIASASLSLEETLFGVIMIVLSAVLTFLIAKYFYFKTEAKGMKEGVMFGLALVIIMFIIEIPVMVYGYAAAQGWNYFTNWHLLLGYLVTFLVAVFVGRK